MKKFLMTAIFYSLLNSTFAQDLDDFEVSEERRIGTILSKSIPFGYYSISLKDKVNEIESKYNIKVFDLDNQEVSSVTFTEQNGINISEVVFNGENILFKIRQKSFTKNKCIFYKLGLDHKFEKIIDYQTEENFKNSDGLYGGIESLRGKFFDIVDSPYLVQL